MNMIAGVMTGGAASGGLLVHGPAGDVLLQKGGGTLDALSAQVWDRPEVKALYDMQARAMGIAPQKHRRGERYRR
ncbi:hypothetical protein [Qipengyuania qiaonensis]|uniref:Uncharacterized protein n=1 Tax=Qipengyuania qiaonensis TaxID=2867240 RepID=A0ABS7JC14_9SPHN|nr:hypothetical protein [Qipengyuania qiaonensis]MBX7483871.1 hypothetical protein [Qipengyuania qiaonensis]